MKALSLFKNGLRENEIKVLREMGIKEIDEPLVKIDRKERYSDYPTLLKFLQERAKEYEILIMPFDPLALYYVMRYRVFRRVIMIRRTGTLFVSGRAMGEIHYIELGENKVDVRRL